MKKQSSQSSKDLEDNNSESNFLNLCCFEVKEALISLYLSIRLRDESSINDLTDEKFENEREQLRHIDSLEIIEHIKKTIEILIFMDEDEIKKQARKKLKKSASKKNLNDKIAHSEGDSYKQGSQYSIDNRFLNDDPLAMILDEIGSQKSTSNTPLQDSQRTSNSRLPREYEQTMQKYEKEIRDHIGVENQMRVFIENLQNQIEDEVKKAKSQEDKISEIKREKRRLDDLLTIRENELDKLQTVKKEQETKESMISELEKKIKHSEKKHEKQVIKLQAELSKYKQRYDQLLEQQANDLNSMAMLNSFGKQQSNELLRESHGSQKISKLNLPNSLQDTNSKLLTNMNNLATNQSIDSILNTNPASQQNQYTFALGDNDSLEHFQKTQQLSLNNKPKTARQLASNLMQGSQHLNQQQQQIYQIQQKQLQQTFASNEMNALKQEYKRQRNNKELSAEKALIKAIQSQQQFLSQSQNNTVNAQQQMSQQQQQIKNKGKNGSMVEYYPSSQQVQQLIQVQEFQKSQNLDRTLRAGQQLNPQPDEINLLQSRLLEYQNQMIFNQQQLAQQNHQLNQQMSVQSIKRKTSNGRNHSNITNTQQTVGNHVNSRNAAQQSSGEKKHLTNSNHKRSKTSLNFYPTTASTNENKQTNSIATAAMNQQQVEKVSIFDLEKENQTNESKPPQKQVKFVSQLKDDNNAVLRSRDQMKRNNSTDGQGNQINVKVQNSRQNNNTITEQNTQEYIMNQFQSKTLDLREVQSLQQHQNHQQLQQHVQMLQKFSTKNPDFQAVQQLNSARLPIYQQPSQSLTQSIRQKSNENRQNSLNSTATRSANEGSRKKKNSSNNLVSSNNVNANNMTLNQNIMNKSTNQLAHSQSNSNIAAGTYHQGNIQYQNQRHYQVNGQSNSNSVHRVPSKESLHRQAVQFSNQSHAL
ncbi:UNKNOWN [Stylonychia lemnae]|uniref:Uncharacterized protein n=1 Tax=Stylonychia lemnae TaxID=5949 RepID=A0A078AQM2_STYLE|nr:UNKNOWN [Stylonychia lemnae]|eukprot:CDW84735.1 UNKNOWN [Stylonychia lemnae]